MFGIWKLSQQPIKSNLNRNQKASFSIFGPRQDSNPLRPSSLIAPVISLKNCVEVGKIELPANVFATPIRPDILHRVVTWHLSCKRQGTASSKTRAEVAGSGRKIMKQKGTGKARVGSIRSPVRRGGGPAHGPKPRDWYYPLPKKVRMLGLRSALSAKFAQNKLVIIDETNLETHKTKEFFKILQQHNWNNALIVDHTISPFLQLAHQNIPNIQYYTEEKLTVYDILHHQVLAVHKDAIPYIEARVTPRFKGLPTIANEDQLYEEDHDEDEGEDDEVVEEGDFDEFLKKEMGEKAL